MHWIELRSVHNKKNYIALAPMDDNLDKKRKIPKLLLWCDFAVTEKFCEEKVQSIINNFTKHSGSMHRIRVTNLNL